MAAGAIAAGLVLAKVLGGGDENTGAKNTTRLVNQVFASVVNEQIQNCETESKSMQNMTFSNIIATQDININASQSQDSQLSTSCAFSAQTENVISTEISNQITQLAETLVGGPFAEVAAAENIADITNQLGTAIRNEFMQNCKSKVVNTQTVGYDNISGRNITISHRQEQNSDVMTTCLASSANIIDITAKLENVIDQTAKATARSALWGVFWVMIATSLMLFIFFVFGKLFFTAKTIKNLALAAIIIVGCVFICALLFMATMSLVDGWPAVKDEQRPTTSYDGEYDGSTDSFKCINGGVKALGSTHCVSGNTNHKQDIGLLPYDPYLRPFVKQKDDSLGGVTCKDHFYFKMDSSGVHGDPWTCVASPTGSSRMSRKSKGILSEKNIERISKGLKPKNLDYNFIKESGYVSQTMNTGEWEKSDGDVRWETEAQWQARQTAEVGDELVGFAVSAGWTRVPNMRNTVKIGPALDDSKGNCSFIVYTDAGGQPTSKPRILNAACCKSNWFLKTAPPIDGIGGTVCVPSVSINQDEDCEEWHYTHNVDDRFSCNTDRMYKSPTSVHLPNLV